jgi:Methyltransferase domain
MLDFNKPDSPLPIRFKEFSSAESYVDSLLEFATSSEQLHTLCGGVHILDFFTRSPDLYATIIPDDWRVWFEQTDTYSVLDVLLREDLDELETSFRSEKSAESNPEQKLGPLPAKSFLDYVKQVRRHCLVTEFETFRLPEPPKRANANGTKIPSIHALTAGMNAKKKHEVSNFARYIGGLVEEIGGISHIVDFGSGANYLGRTLASEPYCNHVIAIESRAHVVQAAKWMDSRAHLINKRLVMRNKKKFKEVGGLKKLKHQLANGENCEDCLEPVPQEPGSSKANLKVVDSRQGSVQYVQHRIEDGSLSTVLERLGDHSDSTQAPEGHGISALETEESDERSESGPPQLVVVSLHSCGNLVHHGLRTLILNPEVKAVAMIGCCYNLATERLTLPTYKVPSLKFNTSQQQDPPPQNDPHGFPMSDRFLNYRCNSTNLSRTSHDVVVGKHETGIRLNITARMMGVQAPRNWSKADSEGFFTRHFYRALLQKIFLDQGIIEAPDLHGESYGRSPAGTGSAPIQGTAPVVIGRLSKNCYTSFVAYVRGAVDKLTRNSTREVAELQKGVERPSASNSPHALAALIGERLCALSDDAIAVYETEYLPRKKSISILWSMMAFSAQIVEALIVVDRWLWLKEQDCVDEAWVQTVFDYSISPRNMVVVGIKKEESSDNEAGSESTNAAR